MGNFLLATPTMFESPERSPGHDRPQVCEQALPLVFCWTKIGAESGQSLEDIVRRKNLERECSGGVFSWGIGNSIGPALEHACRMLTTDAVDAVFTPMKAAPKAIDTAPQAIVMWRMYRGLSGPIHAVGRHMLITSRAHGASGVEKKGHYALICSSPTPLHASAGGTGVVDADAVANVVSSNPVGHSQVTAVVEYRPGSTPVPSRSYPIAFRARLKLSRFVRLMAPVRLEGELLAVYRTVCASRSAEEWRDGTIRLKELADRVSPPFAQGDLLG